MLILRLQGFGTIGKGGGMISVKKGLVVVSVGCLMGLAVPTVAQAQPPSRGCPPPQSGYAPITTAALTQLSLSLGAPPEAVDPAVIDAIDANDDNVVCYRDTPDTPGRPAYLFNVIDNASNV